MRSTRTWRYCPIPPHPTPPTAVTNLGQIRVRSTRTWCYYPTPPHPTSKNWKNQELVKKIGSILAAASHLHTYTHPYIHKYTHIFIYIYICIYIYIHTYTYTSCILIISPIQKTSPTCGYDEDRTDLNKTMVGAIPSNDDSLGVIYSLSRHLHEPFKNTMVDWLI